MISFLRQRGDEEKAAAQPENVLGAATRCEGVLTAEGNLRIDGVFEGNIEATGNVIIGPEARVKADVRARAVQVWGVVQGDIVIEKRLEILSEGRVWGDVEVGALSIDEGGYFEGQCTIAGVTVDPLTAPEKASEPEKDEELEAEAEVETETEAVEDELTAEDEAARAEEDVASDA